MAIPTICWSSAGMKYFVSGEKSAIVAEPIRYHARITTDGSSKVIDQLRFRNFEGDYIEITIEPVDFRDFRKCYAALTNNGYIIPDDDTYARALHRHLISSKPKKRIHEVRSVGWHGDLFVLPDGYKVDANGRHIRYRMPTHTRIGNVGTAGSLKLWKERVATPALASSRMVFCISLAFAAPLLRFTNFDTVGIHLEGGQSKEDSSSIGKTTCILVGASTSGKADRNDLLNWDFTKTGLEDTAMGHNYLSMYLDEIATMNGGADAQFRLMREAAYKLATGRGRIRSSVYCNSHNLMGSSWRLIFLSSGEKAISDLACDAATSRMKGEEVRLIDLPAIVDPERPKWGVFEFIPDGFDSCKDLADSIETAARNNYGHPIRFFVKRVSSEIDTMPAIVTGLIKDFVALAGVPEGGWEGRLARPYSLAYAGACLASRWKIVPWTKSQLYDAILACYVAARLRVPDQRQFVTQGVEHLREGLKREGALLSLLARKGTKVSWSAEDAQAAIAFLGKMPEDNERYIFMRQRVFEKLIGSVRATAVMKHLKESELLRADKTTGLPTVQKKIKGIDGKPRYLAIKASIMVDDA